MFYICSRTINIESHEIFRFKEPCEGSCILVFIPPAILMHRGSVYIGGYVQRSPDDSDKAHPDDYCAVYWLNGEPHSLGDGYESSAVNAMAFCRV